MDLRNWLQAVDDRGKLKVVRGAHWDLEIGGITELVRKRKGSPVLLFDEIPGHRPGYRVCSNAVIHASESPDLVALALQLGGDISTTEELVYALKDRMPRWEVEAGEFPPERVKDGPVLEEIFRGQEVDLLRYPTPRWHEKDGGRYIGTGCAVITQDPETEQLNIGVYRIMVHDARHIGIYMAPVRHGRGDMLKYHAQGQPAPFVISVGHSPLYPLVGGRPIARSVGPAQEFGYIGAVQGRRLPVITGEVTGLPVPADAELVLEGWWEPGVEKEEGPFGEFTGYYGGAVELAPYAVVERIYQRKAPIILGAPPGKHPNYGSNVFASALWLRRLDAISVPGVKMIALHRLASSQLVAVSIEQQYAGHAREVGHIVSHLAAKEVGRFVVVVDEDIDVTDIEDVTFAMATRADPATDIDIVRRAYTQRLDPLLPQGTPREQLFNSRAVIDACIPFERRGSFPEVAAMSPALAEQMLAKWGKELGLL